MRGMALRCRSLEGGASRCASESSSLVCTGLISDPLRCGGNGLKMSAMSLHESLGDCHRDEALFLGQVRLVHVQNGVRKLEHMNNIDMEELLGKMPMS